LIFTEQYLRDWVVQLEPLLTKGMQFSDCLAPSRPVADIVHAAPERAAGTALIEPLGEIKVA